MSNTGESMETQELDVHRAFYDIIFSDSSDSTDEMNEVEQELYDRVSTILDKSTSLSKLVPIMPTHMIDFLDEVQKSDTDFDKLFAIMKNDLVLSGETIRIVNSPLYRRSELTIESIERAISMLGLNGVSQIASVVMLRKVLDIDSRRFKAFGNLLWNHCMECAEACRLLCGDEDPFACYLMGLVHDVGKVALFSCLIQELAKLNNLEINENKVFKIMLMEQSTWLSAHIVEEWHLSPTIVSALYQADRMNMTSLLGYEVENDSVFHEILEKGNYASEVYTLIRKKKITAEEGAEILISYGLSEQSIDEIFSCYEKMQA